MYKIILKGFNKPFTYTAESYELDDFFITFIDIQGTERKVPKERLMEIVKEK